MQYSQENPCVGVSLQAFSPAILFIRHQQLCFPVNIRSIYQTPILKKFVNGIFYKKELTQLKTKQLKQKFMWNLWVFNFISWHAYKEKFKENAHKSKQMVGGKLSHIQFPHVIVRWNLSRLDELKFHPGKPGSCNHHLRTGSGNGSFAIFCGWFFKKIFSQIICCLLTKVHCLSECLYSLRFRQYVYGNYPFLRLWCHKLWN